MTTTYRGWLPEYSVGDETLDNQHKKLLSICVEISALSHDKSAGFSERFHDILHDLSKYAGEHFKHEEHILDELHYDELSEQKQEHRGYFEALSEILFDAIEGKLDIARLDDFTGKWWVSHILESDMKYKRYFEKKI